MAPARHLEWQKNCIHDGIPGQQSFSSQRYLGRIYAGVNLLTGHFISQPPEELLEDTLQDVLIDAHEKRRIGELATDPMHL